MFADKISVIIPVYQVEKYLNKCVDSVIGQTYRNLEILLVDDGSTDASGRICDQYAEKDSRIRVIHKENGGLSDARNAGLSAATGTYVGFVDSDDYIDPRMYETLLERMEKDQSEMAMCNYLSVTETGEETGDRNRLMPETEECLSGRQFVEKLGHYNFTWYVIACNKLCRAELFRNIRFPRGKIHEDEFVAHYLLDQCSRISYVTQPLYYYVSRKESIMGKGLNLKSLDGAEAFLDRMKFAMEKGMGQVAAFSCSKAMTLIADGYLCLDRGSEEVRERIGELVRCARKLYPRFLRCGAGLRSKLVYTLFVINIRCYIFARNCYDGVGAAH